MDPSSPEGFDDSASIAQDEQREDQQTQPNLSPSASAADTSSGQAPKSLPPVQKRRRVTRACDECRRKKIKCDGKQPCTHCTVYSYECTYDQPSNRRRNPTPQYIEAIEQRLHRAEALLKVVLPNVDPGDPDIDAILQQGNLPSSIPGLGQPSSSGAQARPPLGKPTVSSENMKDPHLESMVKATGQLDLDEQGYWDYHGHSSGLSFVRRMREQMGDIMGPEGNSTPFVKTRPMSQVFESPMSNVGSPMDVLPSPELPSQTVARQLCSNSVNDASALLRVVHQPTFWKSFDRIYSTAPENYNGEDIRFLPLLYVVIALGYLFAKEEHSDLEQLGYDNAIDQGFKYFKASRRLLDIADCRDITSLQAIIFMILFLQSSAKLSTCYAYVGVALRSALRMGLHRSFTNNFNPIQAETRKRLFWTLSDDDVDQELPLEVDDEYITETQILPMPEGKMSLITASNAHMRLVWLLSKIVKHIYPIKGQSSQKDSTKSYSVSYAKIREIENDLEEWKRSLPAMLQPIGEAPPAVLRQVAILMVWSGITDNCYRVQHLLRLAYAHAQMMLYRPFLHYTAQNRKSKYVDQRAYMCAAACVNVSRNIIHIASQMKQRGLLNGAFWFTMYTTFFSILSLVFFALENPDNATTDAVLRDAVEGKEVLASLAKRSMAADRCTATLATLFDALPERLQQDRQQNATASKKRRHPLSTSAVPPPALTARSHPDITQIGSLSSQAAPKRAHTHPDIGSSFPKVDTHRSDTSGIPNTFTKSPYLQPPNDSYSSSSMSSTPGMGTPGSSSALFPAVQHRYPNPSTYNNPALPDLSAMMFPSEDPFAYPNAPMTTFENNQFDKNNPFYNFNLGVSTNERDTDSSKDIYMPPPSASGSEGENLDVQLFGPLPPYMMRTQQSGLGLQQNPMGMGASDTGNNFIPTSVDWTGQQNMRTSGLPGMNLDDIFGGEEWNRILMDQVFRQ
ncbi:hypothetical protein B0A49_10847 [Cryomyces minteri]|uniref:Zn(2)-C6 fungal-type domain-containing protein n=1 Tax=Cryomyces minteri TaxID=331657 RepID=A0A4U0WHT5_9PEZI|nr:hypothetical protein B0A49_10847 [Cryomyces minteri]